LARYPYWKISWFVATVTERGDEPAHTDFAGFGNLTKKIGVYALCDLDEMPVYVGQTVSVKERGIIGRVRRHLTSARSDIIANLQLDVWELAFVRAWPLQDETEINDLEKRIYHEYKTTILAGEQLSAPRSIKPLPKYESVRILEPNEVTRRKDPRLRYPRQLRHLDHLLDVILNRKDSSDQRRSLDAHMLRLKQRYEEFIRFAEPESDDDTAE
jgi:hypothetical protein